MCGGDRDGLRPADRRRMNRSAGLTRRRLLRLAGAGAAASGLLLGSGKLRAQTDDAVIAPPGGVRFKDVALTYVQDSGWLHAPLWLSPIFMKDAGVGIKSR